MKAMLITLALTTLAAHAAEPSKLVPINQLGAASYQGFAGGLYADGKNDPSPRQAESLRRMSALVQPLDAQGKPSAGGKIVVAGIGASVCRQIFATLEENGAQTPGINPAVVFVNAAVGGADVNKIADDRYWTAAEKALAARNVTAGQVQVVWYQSDELRDQRDDFPGRPQRLKESFAEQMRLIKAHFPNARLCYHSARHTTAFMPGDEGKSKHAEPRPYHVGWAVKWLIDDQTAGQGNLSFEGTAAAAPLVAWAGYFWTNGAEPRADGYTWSVDLNVNDGVHLTETGQLRVAKELVEFWSRDAFAKTWFTNGQVVAESAPAPSASTERQLKPQQRAALNTKPDEPALLINGKSKFAKLERVLGTKEGVRLIVTDSRNQTVATIEDVFNKHTELKEMVGAGNFDLHFYGKDGSEMKFLMDVPHTVKIK